jgi:hypothetical protein
MLTWQASGGFSLDASVRIHGSDSGGRERLLRYCARPPFALERMRLERHVYARDTTSPGQTGIHQVFYHPARPTRDGRTVLALSPLKFLAALSRLIPPPRVHRHRYHGALAPNARLRERVTAFGREDGEAPGDTASIPFLPREADAAKGDTADLPAADLPVSPQRVAARSRWARPA